MAGLPDARRSARRKDSRARTDTERSRCHDAVHNARLRGTALDGHSRRDRRPDRRVRPVRGPVDTPAGPDRPHVRGGGLPGRDPGPPPGPVRVRLPRDPRRRGRGHHRRPAAGDARPGRLLRGDLDPPGRATRGRHRGLARAPDARAGRARGQGRAARKPAPDVPDAPGAGAPPAEREPVAELTPPADREPDRPYPPGDYPVVVVGSGPGAIQVAYALARLGVERAVISADPAPGGMFRRWPFFQRLLSWTKPYAPVEHDSRAYERYDWNSLLADDPAHRSLMPGLMDGSSYFPSRPEMERNLAGFAEVTGTRIRYDCRWTGTRREEGPDGERFVLETADGEYRARVTIFAVGVAEPYSPPTPGIELSAHYADTRPAETYAGRRLFIMGKQNSGFELATGLLPWARRIVLCSPSPAKLSVNTRSLVGVRARYVQPFEDHVLGGGVSVLDASIGGIVRGEEGSGAPFIVTVRPSDGGEEMALEIDEVISATGFVSPLLDLPELGVATFGQARLPAQTPYWESATLPGIYFAGTI